jgi:DNA-binding NtrC family response regulator
MEHAGHVVVVDDYGETANLLAEVLTRGGWSATGVTSAHACLARVAGGDVAVVITDVQMREVSGLALCRMLRDAHPLIRVVIMTGQHGHELVAAATLAGAFDFLVKPVAIASLERAVAHALEMFRRISTLSLVD